MCCSIFRISLTVWTVLAPLLSAAPGGSVQACAACHAKETAVFLKSPMGNSSLRPRRSRVDILHARIPDSKSPSVTGRAG